MQLYENMPIEQVANYRKQPQSLSLFEANSIMGKETGQNHKVKEPFPFSFWWTKYIQCEGKG